MRRVFFGLALLVITMGANAQVAASVYLQGVEKAQSGEMEEAIRLFSETIKLQPENAYAWYNRGIAKSSLRMYEEALADFEQTVKIAPDYKKGWLNRGLAKKHLTDYDGALADFSHAIELDPGYAEAYYNRGVAYTILGKVEAGCADYQQAKELGLSNADKKVEKCLDTAKGLLPITPIARLTKTASSDKYGFSQEQPVMAGTGPDGGPANQRAYLDLLRDAMGKPIKYVRRGSCCAYKTEHGFIGGMGMLDKYEITFLNDKGVEEKAIVYISFYDYEEPQILRGFKTVGRK